MFTKQVGGCQSAISAATRRYFSCFSLVSWLLSLNYGFSPTSAFQHLVLIYTSRLFSGMAQRAVKDHLCRSQSHSVLPATDQLPHSPLIAAKTPLLSQLISPLVTGFSKCQNLFSHLLQLPTRDKGPIPLPLLFLFPTSFFHPTQLYGDLCCTCR